MLRYLHLPLIVINNSNSGLLCRGLMLSKHTFPAFLGSNFASLGSDLSLLKGITN